MAQSYSSVSLFAQSYHFGSSFQTQPAVLFQTDKSRCTRAVLQRHCWPAPRSIMNRSACIGMLTGKLKWEPAALPLLPGPPLFPVFPLFPALALFTAPPLRIEELCLSWGGGDADPRYCYADPRHWSRRCTRTWVTHGCTTKNVVVVKFFFWHVLFKLKSLIQTDKHHILPLGTPAPNLPPGQRQ